jgi:hypothetical protein
MITWALIIVTVVITGLNIYLLASAIAGI